MSELTYDDNFLLRTVIDSDFRKEICEQNTQMKLPKLVEQQNISFAELMKDVKSDEVAPASDSCRCTCISGLTWKCDGSSL